MNPVQIDAKGKYKYAKTTVNIRASPNLKCKIVGNYYWNDNVKIIKRVNKKWYQVSYKSKKRYVYAKYLKKRKSRYVSYSSPSSKSFKSYEDANCITNNNSFSQGRLKKKYHLDYNTGVWMIGDRYCVALGSYYTKKAGIKVDLVLCKKGKTHILKCITADIKANKDTVNNHKIHTDGSVVEFVVNTTKLSSKVKYMGDVSFAGKIFAGKIIKINVYK